MAKLIYIFSPGHSGSTLLDILLGTYPEIFSTGEFKYFTWQLYRTRNGEGSLNTEDICTCHKRFQECDVWSDIVKRIEYEKNLKIFDNPLLFNTAILESFQYNGHTKLFHKIYNKLVSFEMFYLPFKIFSTLLKKEYINEVKNVWKLIDTIGDVTNSKYIVDSTKSIVRYYLLKNYRPDDVYLIVNSRDNYGYANSFLRHQILPRKSLKEKKRYEKKIEKFINNNNLPLLKTIYEKVARNPQDFLAQIASKLNLKFNPLQLYNIDTRKYHIIAGNPMRYKGEIKIRYDDRWLNELNDDKKQEINYFVKKYDL